MFRLLTTLVAFRAALAQEVGSVVCANCHVQIARSYRITGMARSAGPARAGAPAGVRWQLGSGGVGHSYVRAVDGFLYQAPLSYFAAVKRLGPSPGFELLAPGTRLTRPVEPACLQCHASRLQPMAGTQNGFADPPFLEGGVSCERCHGPGGEHARNPQLARIVNPVKLAADRRDSVCQQCHLTGVARLARAGFAPYVPGGRLADSVEVLVRAEAAEANATTHAEAIASSRCARASGAEKFWCGTCHNPHPTAAQPAIAVRARCQGCHAPAASACAKKGRTDCVRCHMPSQGSRTVDHLAFTDHRILATPRSPSAPARGAAELRSFFGRTPSPRDLAIGYGIAGMSAKAVPVLESLSAETSDDPALLADLAALRERQGRAAEAVRLYERAAALDPSRPALLVNAGALYMKEGRAEEAMRAWTLALERNPGLIAARLNLAVALARAGRPAEAAAAARAVLKFEPAHTAAQRLLRELQ